MIRQSLDADSAQVDAVVHGDVFPVSVSRDGTTDEPAGSLSVVLQDPVYAGRPVRRLRPLSAAGLIIRSKHEIRRPKSETSTKVPNPQFETERGPVIALLIFRISGS